MNLNLRVLQARYGDCLIVEYGSGKRRKNILIDGGPKETYAESLRNELERIHAEGGQLDLMVLTHIDNDHVMGLLEFVKDLKNRREEGETDFIKVRRMWHNAFSKILPEAAAEASVLEEKVLRQPVVVLPLNEPEDPAGVSLSVTDSTPASTEYIPIPPVREPGVAGSYPVLPDFPEDLDYGVGEGVRLQEADIFLGAARNEGFVDGQITLEQSRRPERLAGLRLWVIAPNRINLEELREKWLEWLDEQAGRVSFGVTKAAVKPDDSVNNLSSIMLLVEGGGRTMLLTGDGRSQDIITGLEAIGRLPPFGTCEIDVMKVPHHGSARNAVGDLFERVRAKTYVLSANGKYGNPDDQTLTWLVEAACRQGRDIRLVATNFTPSLARLVVNKPPEENHYTVEVLPEGATSIVV